MFHFLRRLRLSALTLSLLAPALAPVVGHAQTTTEETLFKDSQPPEKGWKGLAKLLDAITPGADTSLPLTPSQITDRISALIDQKQYQQALEVIEKRKAQRLAANALGHDVQLMFLEGRAQAGLGKNEEAIKVFKSMTVSYPELPEPWNNLASIYIKQGRLGMAQDALHMALQANPEYALAKYNLGQVQLMQAYQSFTEAAKAGTCGAANRAQQIESVLAP